MTIWFASGNKHKKKELKFILQKTLSGIEVKIPCDDGLGFNPIENGNSFYENALIKARELYKLLTDKCLLKSGDAVIADDSGICVNALNGRPGIYSARYAGAVGKEEIINSDTDRNLMLLKEMNGIKNRSAYFVCAIVLMYNPDNFYIAQETFHGTLVKNISDIRGSHGFGYDPVLFLPEKNMTVAQLSDEEKNLISHRGKAVRRIAEILKNIVAGTN